MFTKTRIFVILVIEKIRQRGRKHVKLHFAAQA